MIIKVKNLNLTIKKQKILENVSLSCEEGRIYGLVGRNGSGKTMLMKCICGFIRPDEGEIDVLGKRIGKDCDFAPDTGIIIETPGFIGHYSGFKNLKLLAAIKKKIDDDRIREIMEFVGLDPKVKKSVRKYSLGMRQRLGLAQAIMEDPKVLILDEPMNGLDKEGVEDMRKYLLKLREEGKTILIASHSSEDIAVLCDKTYEMEKGVISELSA
ncbi:MAG: ATP-binding cassette domain-containing protein [Lachnospiraceae bacterium]|nr:ATP-binding cassette domain-containing protein [Lachnospiraceae bacterium]